MKINLRPFKDCVGTLYYQYESASVISVLQTLENSAEQCSKLSIYFVHPPGVEGLKIVHLANFV